MQAHRVPFLKTRLLVVAAMTAGLALTAVPANAASADEPSELVANGEFSNGVTGWEAGSGQTLRVRQGSKSAYGVVWSARGGSLSISDKVDTVSSLEPGATYELKADVRTQLGSLSGRLSARETTETGTTAHSDVFTLASGKWSAVSTTFVASNEGGSLDISFLASGAARYQPLQVDNVSLQKIVDGTVTTPKPTPTPTPSPTTPAPKPTPTPTPTPAPPVGGSCVKNPLSGTQIGVSLDIPSGLSLQEGWTRAANAYGTPESVRIFHPGLPTNWNAATVAKGADISVSFKMPPKEVLTGTHDAKLRSWFRSAPNDVEIYWTYFHEPENDMSKGEFAAADYRAAWKRIVDISRETCEPNLHATLVLMDWTVDPRSNRSFNDYYPGSAYIDVLAWDPYNPWNGTVYRDPKLIFGPIVEASRAAGKPFAVAETGSLLLPGDDGSGRAAWLTESARYLREQGALFVTYFDTQTPKGNDFRLNDQKSKDAWRDAIKK